MREMQLLGRLKLTDLVATVGAMLAIGTFFAVTGPLNTDSLGWPWVWLFWCGLMLAGALFAEGASAIMERLLPAAPRWAWIGPIALLVSLPMTALLLVLEWLSAGRMEFPPVHILFAYVFVISLAVTAIGLLIETAQARMLPAPAANRPPAFLKRIPARLSGADLYAISAEDHYLRLHTSRGQDLILMRLSDAIDELAPLEGLRVHRSWWIARTGVERIKRDGEKLTIVLRNGAEAPVARANARTLKDAGWL